MATLFIRRNKWVNSQVKKADAKHKKETGRSLSSSEKMRLKQGLWGEAVERIN